MNLMYLDETTIIAAIILACGGFGVVGLILSFINKIMKRRFEINKLKHQRALLHAVGDEEERRIRRLKEENRKIDRFIVNKK